MSALVCFLSAESFLTHQLDCETNAVHMPIEKCLERGGKNKLECDWMNLLFVTFKVGQSDFFAWRVAMLGGV